jgi:hypothetical protein
MASDEREVGRVSLNPHRHPFNLHHIVVPDSISVFVIPINGDSTPTRSDNRAKIGGTGFPANAVTNLEKSGLCAGHSNTTYSDRAHISASDGEIVRFGR